MLSLIVTIAKYNAIGYKNTIPFSLPNDLKWFKLHTTGKTVIMGRKTFESLPAGALKNRANLILTHNINYKADNCFVCNKISEVFKLLNAENEHFVIGGESVYKQFLKYTDKLYITKVETIIKADSFFPQIDYSEWDMIYSKENKPDKKNNFQHSFYIFTRK